MVDLYVYYKVRSDDSARLAPLVRALQARLLDQAGVRGELKCRPEEKDGLRTWMEIYPAVDDDFAARLAHAAAQAGLEPLTQGPRRVEVFMDLPPCA